MEPNTFNEKATPIQYEFKLELDKQMTITDIQSAGVFGQPTPSGLTAALAELTPAEKARISAAMY